MIINMRVLWFILLSFVDFNSAFGDEIKERISVEKCNEYKKNITTPCVVRQENENHLANPKEFPHMALIGYGKEDDKKWVCPGSLISDRFVLSTGHCVVVIKPEISRVKWVRLGDLDFITPRNDSKFEDYSVLSIHRHPQYRRLSVYNDVGLLRLDRTVIFSEYIRPACLYTETDETLNEFLISGWQFALQEIENKSHLKWAKGIKKVESETCNDKYSSFKLRMKDGINKDAMLCTEQGQENICEITSSRGSPLQIFDEDTCMFHIVGISTFGTDVCYGDAPIVYTKVSSFIDFIERYVWILKEDNWIFSK